MKKFGIIAMAILTVLMMVSIYPLKSVKAGTRADIDLVWYIDADSAFTALTNDQVDMMQWALTWPQKVAVEADPNLQLGQYVENGLWEFDLNNNPTILDYATSTNPCSLLAFRQAIASLVDKDWIISNVVLNFGSRLDAPICFPQTIGWVDPSVVTFDFDGSGVIEPSEDNYPYPYSITAAVNYLADLGFSDTNANGYLNYPNNAGVWGDAAGDDTTTMPLKICIRVEDPNRLGAGRWLYGQLEGNTGVAGDSALATSTQWAARGLIGGDFDTTDVTYEQVRAVLRPIVMRDFNYHVYTGGWSFGRYPIYTFNLFNSMFFYPYGPNYVFGPGVHPTEDALTSALFYSPNVTASQAASKAFTVYHVNNVVNIPIWSSTSYVAWRKELAGVVNMKGYGTVNDFTFLNAWRTKTNPIDPLRYGVVNTWSALNIMYSQWYFEYALMDRVYQGLINANPYDLASDVPWGAQDWEVGSWTDPLTGTDKTKVTYWLNKGQGGAAPVTGDYVGRYNASDYVFSSWYQYVPGYSSWSFSSYMDMNHIERARFPGNGSIIDPYKVTVYFDDVSMWFLYSPTYPLLGPSNILMPMLCNVSSATFTGAQLVESPPGYKEYDFTTEQVIYVTTATINGNPLIEDRDFYVRAGYVTMRHSIFVPKIAIAPGDVIVINYYTASETSSDGIYMAGNLGKDWTDTMYAYGYVYPISISAGSANLNRNPYYFLENVPKGDVDFRWYAGTGAKPRYGNFKIDILDVVKCTGTYSTRGDEDFNPVYLPGADLDDNDLCHIGILDLVTITGKYAQTWGKPPTKDGP